MSIVARLRFFVIDWWQSRSEHRPTGNDPMRAFRDASHVGQTGPNEMSGGANGQRVAELAIEANDRYLESFGED